MRRSSLAIAAIAVAAVVLASCTDQSNPTRPFQRGEINANIVPGTCTSLSSLRSLISTVFGAGSPNASSAIGKINNIDKLIQQGNFADAQTNAAGLISFIQQKASGLPGASQVQTLINAIECYAGLVQNTFLVLPTDPAQTIISADGQSGIQLPANPVSQPTLITTIAPVH